MKKLADFISESEKKTIRPATWRKCKENYPDRIKLFLVGDSWQSYNEDAVKVSNILNIDVLKLSDGEFNEIVSFGVKDLNGNLMKLVRAGEQVVTIKED